MNPILQAASDAATVHCKRCYGDGFWSCRCVERRDPRVKPGEGASAEIQRWIADAVAAEREACAKVAEGERWGFPGTDNGAHDGACETIADAIRARGQK